MKEKNGVKYFEGSDYFRKIKTRTKHNCYFCGDEIGEGKPCYMYTPKEGRWESHVCLKHYNKKIIEEYMNIREVYRKKFNNGKKIIMSTDASGNSGERWAFVVYCCGEEIYRDHGYTTAEINSITPAEGYAVVRAVEWLKEAEEKNIVPEDLPIMVGSDNYAVHRKLDTESTNGKHWKLWKRLMELLLPYRDRLFVGIYEKGLAEADKYCAKSAVENKKE